LTVSVVFCMFFSVMSVIKYVRRNQDGLIDCNNCSTLWEPDNKHLQYGGKYGWYVVRCPKCLAHDRQMEAERLERQAAEEAAEGARIVAEALSTHAVGSSGWCNSLPL